MLRKFHLHDAGDERGLAYLFSGRSLLSFGPRENDERSGTWYKVDAENEVTTVYSKPGQMLSAEWVRHDGTLEQIKRFDETFGFCTEMLAYDGQGMLKQRRIRAGDQWDITLYRADGETPRLRGTQDERGNYAVTMEYDADGSPLVKDPVASVLSCVESGNYASAPAEATYGPTTAESVDLESLLEDHLARLFCIASHDAKALSDGGSHSDGGTQLELEWKNNTLVQASVIRPDGTRVATAVAPSEDRAAVSVKVFHADGLTVARSGCYATTPDSLHRTRWWYEHDESNVLGRIQGFDRNGLFADYDIGPLERPAKERSPDVLSDEAVALAEGPPHREAFLEICTRVEQRAVLEPDQATALVTRLIGPLQSWPSRIRAAPLLWVNRLIRGALPLEALHLVRALSLTAAVAAGHRQSVHYPLLLRWLADYPETGPRLEGVSMSFRQDVATSLQAAMAGQPEVFHPAGDLDFDQTFHLDHDDHDTFFGSALLRDVRVLDLSFEPTRCHFGYQSQEVLDGRGLSLVDVMSRVHSSDLEVLDLWGQCSTVTGQVLRIRTSNKERAAVKAKLAKLRALNVGGGHPVGDDGVRAIASLCPSLERLSLRPGEAGAVLSLDWAAYDEAEQAYLLSDWQVEESSVEKMRISTKGWRALARVSTLRFVSIANCQGEAKQPARVEVDQRPRSFGIQSGPRVAQWDDEFEE
ncbi:MAG: hypothetical protein AAF799_08060 [Myxococcota bacterium]